MNTVYFPAEHRVKLYGRPPPYEIFNFNEKNFLTKYFSGKLKIPKLSGNLRPCPTHRSVGSLISVVDSLIATAVEILEKWEN